MAICHVLALHTKVKRGWLGLCLDGRRHIRYCAVDLLFLFVFFFFFRSRKLPFFKIPYPAESDMKRSLTDLTLVWTRCYAPINGLPQDGGWGGGGGRAGNPRELDFLKRTGVGILTFTTVPRVGPTLGKFDSTAILKRWEDLGMSDWASFPRPRMVERKVRSIAFFF